MKLSQVLSQINQVERSKFVSCLDRKTIVSAYKARRNPNFSAKILTKGGLFKADLIAKKI